MFLAFWLLRPTYQQEATWSISWSTWPSTWSPKSTKNPLKRLPKSIAKGMDNMMQVGMAFGTLLERILVDFGSNLGGKLEPSSLQNLSNMDQNTMLDKYPKNASQKVTQAMRGSASRGGVPLKSLNTDLPGTTLGIRHSSRATRARWRMTFRMLFVSVVGRKIQSGIH